MSGQVPSRFLPFSSEFPATSTDTFDFDESDLWLSQSPSGCDVVGKAELVVKKPNARVPRRSRQPRAVQSASMPVNMPVWRRIGVASTRLTEGIEDDCDGKDEVQVKKEKPRSPTWVPPHEYLARQRQQQGTVLSCSMEEGIGGTLKGRELKRVRDAIWKKTGFID